jgi:hypothetical protein
MLDATLVLQEAELLLDDHYTVWRQRMVGRVRVYEKPQPQQSARQGPPALTKMNGSSQQPSVRATSDSMPDPSRSPRSASIGDAVANVLMLFLLTVLSERLTRGRSR